MITYKLGSKAYRDLLAEAKEKPLPPTNELLSSLFKCAVVDFVGNEIVCDGDLEPEAYEVWTRDEDDAKASPTLLEKGKVQP